MDQSTVVLFGSVSSCDSRVVQRGDFSFHTANVNLHQPQLAPGPSLADYLKSHPEFPFDTSLVTPWVRGRIERLFHVKQDDAVVETVTNMAERTIRDRLFLKFGFVGVTELCGLKVAVPFVCSEYFGEPHLTTGEIPVRNSDRYTRLVSGMIVSFWQLLLDDVQDVADYEDVAVIFDQPYKFGIVGGRPYSEFPQGGVSK